MASPSKATRFCTQRSVWRYARRIGAWSLALWLATGLSLAQDGNAIWPDEAQCREVLASNADQPDILRGWCLSITKTKGNCLACHVLNVSPWPDTLPAAGNIAPPLVAMTPRFPDIAALRSQIEDASAANPHTSMPPYIRHGILTQEELDLIMQFLLSI